MNFHGSFKTSETVVLRVWLVQTLRSSTENATKNLLHTDNYFVVHDVLDNSGGTAKVFRVLERETGSSGERLDGQRDLYGDP